MQEFTLAMLQAIFPWVTLWVLAKYFLLQGKTNAELIRTLTQQVVATKNPWAAQQALQAMAGERRAEAQLQDIDLTEMVPQGHNPDEEEDLI